MLKIDPIAHLSGKFCPLGGIFHDLTSASGVVFVHRNFLSDVLFGDTEHFLDAKFDGKSVCIPSGFAVDLEALHGFVPAEGIFNCSSENVVDSGFTVSRRRSFKEIEGFVPFPCRNTFVEQVFVVPRLQHIVAELG